MKKNKSVFFENKYGIIYAGHALSILNQMAPKIADMAIVAPPFWSGKEYGLDKQSWGDWRGSLGAENTASLYLIHLIMIFNQIRRILKPGGVCWLNIGDSVFKKECGLPFQIIERLRKAEWFLIQDFIWLKENIYSIQKNKKFSKNHEYLFTLSLDENNNFDIYNSMVRKSVWMIENEKPDYSKKIKNGKIELEPILKFGTLPKQLIRNCIEIGCPKGGTVFDPFLGGGNTFTVSKDTGRKCIGIELDIETLENYTLPKIKSG